MKKIARVAMLVGEASGDILGADLMEQIKLRYPDCTFEGIGGERMLAQGFKSFFPMERLAVMGLVEPLKRLPELLSIRRKVRTHFINEPPDVFIGIDAPDFNLSLEAQLKQQGIPVVHYVSPSVWAWRQGRIKKIKRSIDLMLTLFPFEKQIYLDNNIAVEYVGHPLADKIPLQADIKQAKLLLGLPQDSSQKYLALLPGSRASEIRYMLPTFLQAADIVCRQQPKLNILIPAANKKREDEINLILTAYPTLPVTVFAGQSHQVLAVSDAVLITSGTATLEAMLLKCPMVIAYKMSGFTFAILKRIVKSKFVGLPNLLANKQIVPELIQADANPVNIAEHLNLLLVDDTRRESLHSVFCEIHKVLRINAGKVAAQAIEEMLNTRS